MKSKNSKSVGRVLGALCASMTILGGTASADQYFQNTRIDPSMPSNCAQFELRAFSSLSRVMLVGPEGARGAGFTLEYPIGRAEATTLWMALRPQSKAKVTPDEIRNNPRLNQQYTLLLRVGPELGFDFGKEGDILEALVVYGLRSDFPESTYYITGGVSYRENAGTAPAGELDVIVGRRSDCSVVAIGEAKLGLEQKPHAVKQMQRFTGFLKRHLCAPGAREAVCSLRE